MLLRNKRHINQKLFITMIITAMAFILRDGFNRNVPLYFFLAHYALSFIFMSRDDITSLFLFLIPLSVGPLLYYLNVVYGLIFFIKNRRRLPLSNVVIISFVLFLWEAAHVLINIFAGYDDSIIKLLGFGLCLLVLAFNPKTETVADSYTKMLYSWCSGFASLCGILLLKYMNQFGIGGFPEIVRRFGFVRMVDTTSTSLLINPNQLGRQVIITVFCLLTVVHFDKQEKKRAFSLIAFFVPFGLMSGSRAFLLVGFIVGALYLVDNLARFKANWRQILLVLVMPTLIAFFVNHFMGATVGMISRRLASQDVSGGRIEIYGDYLSRLLDSASLIVGRGMQDYNDKYGVAHSTHNLILEIVVMWGIIGLLIVGLWSASLHAGLELATPVFRKTIIPYLPLLGLFLNVQFGQFFISYYHTFPTLMLALFNIKYADSKLIRIG